MLLDKVFSEPTFFSWLLCHTNAFGGTVKIIFVTFHVFGLFSENLQWKFQIDVFYQNFLFQGGPKFFPKNLTHRERTNTVVQAQHLAYTPIFLFPHSTILLRSDIKSFTSFSLNANDPQKDLADNTAVKAFCARIFIVTSFRRWKRTKSITFIHISISGILACGKHLMTHLGRNIICQTRNSSCYFEASACHGASNAIWMRKIVVCRHWQLWIFRLLRCFYKWCWSCRGCLGITNELFTTLDARILLQALLWRNFFHEMLFFSG